MKNDSYLDKYESRTDNFCWQIRYKIERKRGEKDGSKIVALATGSVKLPFTKMEKRQEEQVSGEYLEFSLLPFKFEIPVG